MSSSRSRIAFSSGLHPEDPVGHLAGKVNSLYFVHAGWFSVSAIALFGWARLYRPLPNSRVGQRLIDVAKACAVGFGLHLLLGGALQCRIDATLQASRYPDAASGTCAFAKRGAHFFELLHVAKEARVSRRDAQAGV